MRWFTRHPDDRELNRFADGELGERELARVSDHLARCPRCRGEVALVRRMADSARTLPGPLATDEVLRRALARRAAGDRVLLPNSDAGAPRRRPVTRFAPAAIAALLTLMVASLVVSVRVLEADRPALRLHPERPAAGEALRVEYHGGSLFADQTHLKLRARFRTADDRHWQLLAGILVRDEDGTYRTEVQLPDSVVYAAFAVEDLHGQRLDSNNRELWDVMVHRDGQPTLGGMTARLRDLERRDWGGAYAVSKQMTEMYPDSAQSWAIRFSFEVDLFDRDSIEAVHRGQLERLERDFVEAERPDSERLAWLGLYAIALGNMSNGEAWITEATNRQPWGPTAVEGQMALWSRESIEQPDEVLSKLAELWERPGPKSKSVANLGWQVATEAGNMDAAQLWMERYLELYPEEALAMGPRAYRISGGAGFMGDWIERVIVDLQMVEGLRPIQFTQAEFERLVAEELQRLLATVATEAWRSGDSARAIHLATKAVDLAWESAALLDLSTILIDGRESEAGIGALARASADPATAAAARTRASQLPPAEFQAWHQRSATAESELHDYVMEGAVVRYIDLDIPLRKAAENQILRDLQGHDATVLAFMSRLCAPALEQMPRLADLDRELSASGARLVVIDVDNVGDLRSYAQRIGLPMDIYVDHTGALRSHIQSSATPDLFVLDAAGRVRFEHSRLEAVLRQVEAIKANVAPVDPAFAD